MMVPPPTTPRESAPTDGKGKMLVDSPADPGGRAGAPKVGNWYSQQPGGCVHHGALRRPEWLFDGAVRRVTLGEKEGSGRGARKPAAREGCRMGSRGSPIRRRPLVQAP